MNPEDKTLSLGLRVEVYYHLELPQTNQLKVIPRLLKIIDILCVLQQTVVDDLGNPVRSPASPVPKASLFQP